MAAINTDMNGKIYDALVQFGCHQHKYEWKGLWCSNYYWAYFTLTSSLVVFGLALMIIDTFSKAVVDILEVISGLVMLSLLFLQLVLLYKVKKVSQNHSLENCS